MLSSTSTFTSSKQPIKNVNPATVQTAAVQVQSSSEITAISVNQPGLIPKNDFMYDINLQSSNQKHPITDETKMLLDYIAADDSNANLRNSFSDLLKALSSFKHIKQTDALKQLQNFYKASYELAQSKTENAILTEKLQHNEDVAKAKADEKSHRHAAWRKLFIGLAEAVAGVVLTVATSGAAAGFIASTLISAGAMGTYKGAAEKILLDKDGLDGGARYDNFIKNGPPLLVKLLVDVLGLVAGGAGAMNLANSATKKIANQTIATVVEEKIAAELATDVGKASLQTLEKKAVEKLTAESVEELGKKALAKLSDKEIENLSKKALSNMTEEEIKEFIKKETTTLGENAFKKLELTAQKKIEDKIKAKAAKMAKAEFKATIVKEVEEQFAKKYGEGVVKYYGSNLKLGLKSVTVGVSMLNSTSEVAADTVGVIGDVGDLVGEHGFADDTHKVSDKMSVYNLAGAIDKGIQEIIGKHIGGSDNEWTKMAASLIGQLLTMYITAKAGIINLESMKNLPISKFQAALMKINVHISAGEVLNLVNTIWDKILLIQQTLEASEIEGKHLKGSAELDALKARTEHTEKMIRDFLDMLAESIRHDKSSYNDDFESLRALRSN